MSYPCPTCRRNTQRQGNPCGYCAQRRRCRTPLRAINGYDPKGAEVRGPRAELYAAYVALGLPIQYQPAPDLS